MLDTASNTTDTTMPAPINEPHLPRRFLDLERDDATTYLSQHPMWEPYIDGAVLADNGQDLEETIGKRTVRLRAMDHDVPTAVALDGKACHVCGLWFRTPSNVARLVAMDQVTEPFGGREALGAARTYFGTLRNPVITISVRLPIALGAMLAVDGVQREVWVTWRDALDGTQKGEFYTTVLNRANHASVLLRGTGVALTHKHTNGIRLVPAKIAKFAADLPGRIAEHAAGLAKMLGTVLTRSEVEALALRIANDGEDPEDGDEGGEAKEIKPSVKRVADSLVGMILAADGKHVPLPQEPGTFNALQVFEAACAYDRHYRTVRKTGITDRDAVVRMSRVLDGDTYGDTAWNLLAE